LHHHGIDPGALGTGGFANPVDVLSGFWRRDRAVTPLTLCSRVRAVLKNAKVSTAHNTALAFQIRMVIINHTKKPQFPDLFLRGLTMSSLPLRPSAPSDRTSLTSLATWPAPLLPGGLADSRGEIGLAFRRCHMAWQIAHHGPAGHRTSGAEECLANLVNQHLQLADLLNAEGDLNQVAETLADIHQKLLLFIAGATTDRNWSQAALWHVRITHRALLVHLSEHGWHPAIERALRAGCLSIQLPAAAHWH